jgi:hypothetical protein
MIFLTPWSRSRMENRWRQTDPPLGWMDGWGLLACAPPRRHRSHERKTRGWAPTSHQKHMRSLSHAVVQNVAVAVTYS